MKKIVRQTTAADYATVYQLIKTAFETAVHRDGTEQDFAVTLRESENYIPRLDLVAEIDGHIVGHILFTHTTITTFDGDTYDTLLVAPLSVLLEYRNQAVGAGLMNEGLRIAAEMGYTAAFLLGDPDYYSRFGYQPSALYGIGHPTFPAEYLLAKEIVSGALKPVSGTINI